jgi:hypothetical protein
LKASFPSLPILTAWSFSMVRSGFHWKPGCLFLSMLWSVVALLEHTVWLVGVVQEVL